jgi:dihydrofolate synthase/folylpolyglutamate synthase
VDCCINRVSAEAALETVRELGLMDVTFILAVPDDKDYEGVSRAVAEKGHRIVLTKVANPHYRFEGIQQARLKDAGICCEYVPDLETAINGTSGHVVVLGTTDMLKEIKRMDRRM